MDCIRIYIGSDNMADSVLKPMTIKIPEKLHNGLRALAARKDEFLYQTAERLLQKGLQIEQKEGKENG